MTRERALRTLLLVAVILIAASTFLAWGSPALYLPWSIRPLGGYILPRWGRYALISFLVRIGAICGWIGYLLLELSDRRVIAYLIIAFSGAITLTSIILFTLTGLKLSIGAYLALVGGCLELISCFLGNVEIEIVWGEEVEEALEES